MKRKALPFILISMLGLILFFVWRNPFGDNTDKTPEVSYDGIQIVSLSVYEYRPIFISSLGERLRALRI